MTYVSVDADLDDIISGLSDREKQDLIDDLYEDGYYQSKLENQLLGDTDNTVSVNEQLFRTGISKLSSNYLNLTHSELDILENIAKRF
jgi:hypothetical protein